MKNGCMNPACKAPAPIYDQDAHGKWQVRCQTCGVKTDFVATMEEAAALFEAGIQD